MKKNIFGMGLCILASMAVLPEAQGQTLHPFAAPKRTSNLTQNSVVGILDINRDSSPDVLVPGFIFSTFFSSFDEEGTALGGMGTGPALTVQNGQFALPLAMAGGDIDQDDIEDLVTVNSAGTVNYLRNLGSTRLNASNFAPQVVIDNFQARYPTNPPFVSYVFPFLEIADLDGDGNNDVLTAGAPVDFWSGYTRPGFLGFYKGDGLGNFQPYFYPIPGNVIDGQFADLDGNGSRETLVILAETGSVGAFAYEFFHVRFSGGALLSVSPAQNVGLGKLTAFEMADVVGDANPDYLVSYTYLSGGVLSSGVYYFEGNGQGTVNTSSWGQFYLPANTTGLGDFISSIRVADFNRDSNPDLVILRNYTQASPQGSSLPAQYADSELFVLMGPNLPYASAETIALGGYVRQNFTDQGNLFSQAPLRSEAQGIRLIEFGGKQGSDLVIPGVFVTSPTQSQSYLVTLQNLTAPQQGDAAFEKVGDPSGGVAGYPARIGFDGGRPVLGNPNFGATVSNIRGGSLVGLVWGPLGFPSLFTSYGVTANLIPTDWGVAGIASGTGLGNGFYRTPLAIPNNPALVGMAGYFQYNYYDFVSGVFGGTQATGVWIGQ